MQKTAICNRMPVSATEALLNLYPDRHGTKIRLIKSQYQKVVPWHMTRQPIVNAHRSSNWNIIVNAMKLTFLLLLAAFLSVHASVRSQTVTFTGQRVNLLKVFSVIEEQTGYVVFYNRDLLKEAKPVTVNAQAMPLDAFLKQTLGTQALKFNFTNKTITVFRNPEQLSPQILLIENAAKDLRGQVLDMEGKPVPGATIAVKNSTKATSANADGSFILQGVPDDATIIISAVGFTPTEIGFRDGMPYAKGKAAELSNRDDGGWLIRIAKSNIKLNEVQITAYNIEKRTKELGYSIAKVSGEEINKANSGNLLTGLIGKVSGMTITTQSSDMTPEMRILVRGIRSFGANSNNQPMFILNGAPLSFGTDQTAAQQVMSFINNINPADIDNVTVLKGANGTAMYGPEGINGVIIITTKRGAAGKPTINFRNNTSFQRIDYRQERKQRAFGSGSGVLDAFGNGVYDSRSNYGWGPAYDDNMVQIGYPDESGEWQMVPYHDTKQARQFMNVAKTVRNNLSFSSSDARSSFYLGLGQTAQTGLLPGDKQQQQTVLLNTSRNFGLVDIRMNINYARTTDDRGPDVADLVRNLPTFIPILNYKDYKNAHWAHHDRYWNGISPYEQIDNTRSKSTTNAVSGNLIFEIKPFTWLNIRDQPGMNYTGVYKKSTVGPIYFSDFAAQDYNKMYDKRATVGEDMLVATSINNDFVISTIHHPGNFLIRTNVGNTIRENYSKNLKAGAELVVPVYNLAFAQFNVTPIEVAVLSRSWSLFGNVLVGYKDRLFLELTGRNEWDSKRAKVARGQDMYFGANTSAVLSEIFPVMKEWKWLTTARLRASVAQSANMNIAPYQSERTFGLNSPYPLVNNSTGDYLLGYSFYPSNPNPLLKPERVISQEYGGNFTFLNDRINFDATYYYQRNNSVILNVNNSWLSGYPSIDNAGDFQNNGWEFDLKMDPIFQLPNKMSLSLEARLAINDNKVLYLTDVYNGLFPVMDATGQTYYAQEGKQAFSYAFRDWKRDPEGRVIVDKVTGLPQSQDYDEFELHGRTLPKYAASIGLNFSWKSFSASVLMDYLGGYDHKFSTDIGLWAGLHTLTTLNGRERFVFPNSSFDDGTGKYVPNTDVVVSNANQELFARFSQVSLHGFTSAAFWKVREVAFQYVLPFKRGILKEATCSLYGRDLFSFYPRSNINGDPGLIKGPGQRNFTSVSNNLTGGSSDQTALPGTVLYGFTVGLKF
ncbi:SusC/RagA family TonB-linked outer membrane protein [Chitinophaga sp. SYP-B3965]|uniref:SusC/RagA family TonB-linked outer membrane protein n=1 Tax=Chitinophaga sp. SYP-B3965 TaxID=2663120 RepID=UPI0012997831|nr:SusC/RagA family TonB-linked outer membrane protein [Chitinophaga sp. SYP-B3965]MRG45475.1 SusC/RagA family TonB-linked outer membrane protein [Chitinophaga sp. SYP-B3965]